MSVYTTQLRYLCEAYAGRSENASLKESPAVIAAARQKLFDFSYPLFNPDYKGALETKIINHFYFREIGAETVGQFKFMLSRTLNECMPFYNQLYESAEIKFNPFHDVDYFKEHRGSDQKDKTTNITEQTSATGEQSETRTTETTTDGTLEGTTNRTIDTTEDNDTVTTHNTTDTKTLNTTDTKTLNTSDTRTLNTKDTVRESDTPQGGLTGIESNDYLSRAVITDKTGTDTMARSGSESMARTGTESDARTGTESTSEDNTRAVQDDSSLSQTSQTATQETGERETTSESNETKSSSGADSISGTDQYIDHVYGKVGTGSYAGLLKEYRETLINIDMMVINELEVCFMNVY